MRRSKPYILANLAKVGMWKKMAWKFFLYRLASFPNGHLAQLIRVQDASYEPDKNKASG